jgi:hypothetical protein
VSTDLETRLRRDLPRLGALVEEGIEVPMARRPPRRRAAVAALVAVIVLVAAIATAVVVTRHRSPDVVTTIPPATWRVVPPSSLGPRAGVVTAWTGHEVIVWGGYRGDGVPMALQTGAAYDPATNHWRDLTANQWGHPGAVGAYLDGHLYVLAKEGGAAYDVARDSWHDLALLPGSSGGFAAAVASPTTVYGIVRGDTPGTYSVATYEAMGDRWDVGPVTRLRSVFDVAPHVNAAWHDGEVIVTDGSGAVAGYDTRTRSWRPIEDAGLPTSAVAVVNVDSSVYAVSADGAGLHASVLDGHTWNIVANDETARITTPVIAAGGGALWVVDATGRGAPRRLDLNERRWTPIGDVPIGRGRGTTAAWTGDGLFVWGGLPAGTPPTFANPSPNEPEAAILSPT